MGAAAAGTDKGAEMCAAPRRTVLDRVYGLALEYVTVYSQYVAWALLAWMALFWLVDLFGLVEEEVLRLRADLVTAQGNALSPHCLVYSGAATVDAFPANLHVHIRTADRGICAAAEEVLARWRAPMLVSRVMERIGAPCSIAEIIGTARAWTTWTVSAAAYGPWLARILFTRFLSFPA